MPDHSPPAAATRRLGMRRPVALAAALMLAASAQAATAPSTWREPVPGVSASATPSAEAAPWWAGFHDPVLDELLQRLGQDRSLRREARRELEIRTAGLYVQMRSLALRTQLVDEWLGLLGEQASVVQAQGPTREAAQVRSLLDQQSLVLQQRQHQLVERLEAWKAVLARLQGQDLALPDALDRQLMQPTPPWFSPEGPVAELAWRWAPDETRASLVQREQTLQAAQQAWQRQRAQVQAIERQRAQHAAGDAEVAQAVQQLLLRIDALADASADLALAWIGVFADAPLGVLQARQAP